MTAPPDLQRAYKASLDCVHCGLCLPSCPTYATTTNETDSPRGRIYLMRALAEGRIDIDDKSLRGPLDRCLGCRACESACPSGVRYGELLEETREAIGRVDDHTWRRRALRSWLDRFIAHPRGHRLSMSLLATTQRLRLDRASRALPLPGPMRRSLELMPKLAPSRERRPLETGIHEPKGPVRATVGLFTGCMMETVFGRVNRALLSILLENGCRVHVPAGQGCCGALHVHAGLRERARPLVDANIAAFGKDLDAIILDSAGCGSAMKEYGHWHEGAAAFANKVRDMSEFLDELGFVPGTKRVEYSACYDDPCHLCHGQGIRSAPRRLLAAIPGLTLKPLSRPEDCCGSAGIYNLVQADLADSILGRKIDDITRSGADVCITANPGCMLQIEMGLRRRGSKVRVLHIAEVLAASY
ncbi:MAG: (Fe-S)-binding protein [Planctomycetes bacterium]|nr:(Fe-S)-binding protein [Planctomycetota bacterium]